MIRYALACCRNMFACGQQCYRVTQVTTFAHELSEARPRRGTAAAARAPRNGTHPRRRVLPSRAPPDLPCLTISPACSE